MELIDKIIRLAFQARHFLLTSGNQAKDQIRYQGKNCFDLGVSKGRNKASEVKKAQLPTTKPCSLGQVFFQGKTKDNHKGNNAMVVSFIEAERRSRASEIRMFPLVLF